MYFVSNDNDITIKSFLMVQMWEKGILKAILTVLTKYFEPIVSTNSSFDFHSIFKVFKDRLKNEGVLYANVSWLSPIETLNTLKIIEINFFV